MNVHIIPNKKQDWFHIGIIYNQLFQKRPYCYKQYKPDIFLYTYININLNTCITVVKEFFKLFWIQINFPVNKTAS